MPSEKKGLLDLTSTAEHELSPVRMVAHETISELFHFQIEAVATGTIDARGMLNKPACLSVNHGDKETRYFHGIVAEFGPIEQSGTVDTLYRMILVPQLAQAGIRSDCRLFFNKTAEDILKIIFNDAGVTKTAFRLYSQPKQRKATAQFNETSLHFATRLMEEEGWFYFFEHASDGHTLVVTNDNNGFTNIPGASVHLGPGTTAAEFTEFRKTEAFAPGKVSLRDYDFDVPSKNLKVDQNTVLKHGGTANRAVFHWPALTRDTSQAKDRAKWRMEAAEAAVSLVSGGGDLGSLFAGGKFKLREKAGAETVHVVREITHFAEDDSGSRRGDSASTYSNNFIGPSQHGAVAAADGHGAAAHGGPAHGDRPGAIGRGDPHRRPGTHQDPLLLGLARRRDGRQQRVGARGAAVGRQPVGRPVHPARRHRGRRRLHGCRP